MANPPIDIDRSHIDSTWAEIEPAWEELAYGSGGDTLTRAVVPMQAADGRRYLHYVAYAVSVQTNQGHSNVPGDQLDITAISAASPDRITEGRITTEILAQADYYDDGEVVVHSSYGYQDVVTDDVGNSKAERDFLHLIRPRVPTPPSGASPQISLGERRNRTQRLPGVHLYRARSATEAARLLGEGHKVELNQPRQVSTLIVRLAAMVHEAEAKGNKAPNFNLCDVTVRGSNLFCIHSKGIPRISMPQLKGIALPGSRAAQLPLTKSGKVDLAQQFREHLTTKKVEIKREQVNAGYLKASQNELIGSKVARIAGEIRAKGKARKDAIFVSRDDYIVDGHHHWAATIGVDLEDGQIDTEVKIDRVDMGIIDLLAEAHTFSRMWGLDPEAAFSD